MATDAELTAAGYAMPQGQDLVTHGDDAIRTNAHRSYAIELRAGGVNGQPPVLNATHNVDSHTLTGDYAVWSGSNRPANWPDTQPGHLRVQQIGTIVYQTVSTINGIWRRVRSVTWTPWTKDARVADLPAPPPPTAPNAPRTARVALSAPAGTNTQAGVTALVRIPIHLAPTVHRWRLHIANRNDRTGETETAGSIGLSGVWAGPGWDGTFTSTPTTISGNKIIRDGETFSTAWISNRPLGGGTQMMVSVGLNAPAGTTIHRTTAGAWVDPTTQWYGSTPAAPANMARVTTVPLSWWLEVEVAADVPIVATWGDSLAVGTGNTLPVNDAPLAQWARAHGAIPVLMAYPGTGMIEWEDDNDHRFDPFTGQRPDAIVHHMGQNDLAPSVTLAEMQRRYTATIGSLTRYGAPVYLATITPTSTKDAAQNTVRKDYNTWLATLPDPDGTGLVRDAYALAAAVANTTDDALAAAYDSGDALHLNTAGSAALATALAARPLV